MRRTWQRCSKLIVAVGVMLGVWAAPVFAAVEARPGEVPAGSKVEVGFLVTQGCGGSPTTSLAILLPTEVSASPLPAAGFARAVAEGQAVRWTGGSLPANQQQVFPVRLRLPNVPGATLYFPVVQTCQAGEVRWVEVPGAGQDPRQLKSPAAVLRLTAAAPPQVGAPPQAGSAPQAGVTSQAGSSQSGTGQPGVTDPQSAGTRPKGGVPAGAGGRAGGSVRGLLTIMVAGLIGGGVLFIRLIRDA